MKCTSYAILLLILMAYAVIGCSPSDGAVPEKEPEKVEATQKSVAPPKNEAKDPDGCSPEYRALFDQAVVELKGKGDLDILVITDPLCWHCRLGHKLLGEYPEKYGRVRLLFYPRKSFIGSDMAAWILESVAGTDRVQELVDFAYTDLKQPKTKDLLEARLLVFIQFTERFPDLFKGTPPDEAFLTLQKNHEKHVLESAMLSRAAKLPGTPVLVAGKRALLGYGPGPWLEAMDAKEICE